MEVRGGAHPCGYSHFGVRGQGIALHSLVFGLKAGILAPYLELGVGSCSDCNGGYGDGGFPRRTEGMVGWATLKDEKGQRRLR